MRLRLVAPNNGNKWLIIYNFGVSYGYDGDNDGSQVYRIYVYNTSLKFKICEPNEEVINYYVHIGRLAVSGTYVITFGGNGSSDDRKAFCIAIAIK